MPETTPVIGPPNVAPLTLEGVAQAVIEMEEAIRAFIETLNRRLTTRDELVEAALVKVENRAVTIDNHLEDFLRRAADIHRTLQDVRGRTGPPGPPGAMGPMGAPGRDGLVTVSGEAFDRLMRTEIPAMVERTLTPRFAEVFIRRFLDENRDEIMAYLSGNPDEVRDEEER